MLKLYWCHYINIDNYYYFPIIMKLFPFRPGGLTKQITEHFFGTGPNQVVFAWLFLNLFLKKNFVFWDLLFSLLLRTQFALKDRSTICYISLASSASTCVLAFVINVKCGKVGGRGVSASAGNPAACGRTRPWGDKTGSFPKSRERESAAHP